MIIVNGWKPLIIITKRSILDVTAVLDPLLKYLEIRIDQNLNQHYVNGSLVQSNQYYVNNSGHYVTL